MKPEEPEEPYNGDPIAEEILKFNGYIVQPIRTSLGHIIAENFKKLEETQAEDFVFLCQCGIMPDLSLD